MIVHSDAFLVGADTDINVYGDWDETLGNLIVEEATDRVEMVATGADCFARWNGAGSPVEGLAMADLFTWAGADPDYGTMGVGARLDASGNGYLSEWDPRADDCQLYRVTGGGATFTLLEELSTTDSEGSIPNAYIQALGTGATVNIEIGDDNNGAAIIVFADTDAARHTSGLFGISGFNNAAAAINGGANPAWLDNFEIDNLLAAPSQDHRPVLALQQRY